jgi:4-amino-4-deoxy-L-arabinose transferase-like glycosyltransferase
MREKPPLISALPTPVYLVFGRKPRAALVVNLAALLITFSALFCFARKYAGPRAGLIAVTILGTMPMIYGLSHWYLVECGLTAIVCLTISLPATRAFDPTVAAALGALCALGMLMKFSFPLYVAAPLALLLWRQVRFKLLGAFLLPAAVIALPWYIVNFARGLHTALNAGSAQTALVYRTGDALSPADIARYLRDVANCAPAIYLVVLAVTLLVCYPAASKNARRGLALSAVWASPLVLLALGHYRDLRYAAPLFPAVALALGILLDSAIARYGAFAGAATCFLLGLGVASMLATVLYRSICAARDLQRKRLRIKQIGRY